MKGDKMKRTCFFILVCMVLFICSNESVRAAQSSKTDICGLDDISCWVNKLQSPNRQERARAMYRLGNLPPEQQSEEVKTALIKLLEKESKKMTKPGIFTPEEPIGDHADCGECEEFGYLCKMVSKFADPRAYPIFLKIGDLESLSEYGEISLDAIIPELKNLNSGYRAYAVGILDKILTPKENRYTAQGEARNKIRATLLEATKDSDGFVRLKAVKALSNFEDDEVVSVLENIKNNDPYPVKNLEGKYLVRQEAEKALEKIKKAKGE